MIDTNYESVDPTWMTGDCHLIGPINEDSVYYAIKFILWHNQMKYLKHLRLIISSEGGCLTSAVALINTMRLSAIPVHTMVIGEALSAGLFIAMAGKPGYRTIMDNAMVLSHQYSTAVGGTHADLIAARKQQDITNEIILELYKECTGKDEQYIMTHLQGANDIWLTAQEAQSHGLFDLVQHPPV